MSIKKGFLVFLLLAIPAFSHAALQMHLELDNNLTDSANSNNGVLPGGSSNPNYVTAIIKQGLEFDGNDYIRVPSFDPGSSFSVATWVRMENIGSLNTFIEYVKTNNRNNFYLGYDNSQNQLFVELDDNNTTEGGSCGSPKFCTGIRLTDERWYHITVTVTPTTLKVYLDGELAYNTTHSTTVAFNPGGWLIGADSDSNPYTTANNDYLDGRLDDIRVYSHELNQAEINTLIGIMASWQFDQCSLDGTANEVVDSSGNNYHGTAANGATTDVGKICRGGLFDGSNNYIGLPSLPNLNTSFTITAWIKPDVIDKDQRIFVDDDNNNGGFAFSLGDGGNGRLRLFSRGINPVVLDSSAAITAGNWYFVAAVHDATAKTRQIFVNGNPVTPVQTYTGSWGTDNGLAAIGGETNNAGSENNANWRFDGAIDEVKVYSRPLSENELEGYYDEANPLNRSCPNCAGPSGNLEAYYKMDEASWGGTPNDITDDSGKNNDADNVNAAQTVADGKVCRGGKIDTNGEAIDTQLDVNGDIGETGTVSFWFRPDWTNSGSERNISRVLFDASRGSKYFKFAKTRNASGPPNAWRQKLILMFEDDDDRDRAVYSSDLSIFQANAWVHLAVTWDYPNEEFEIYVNSIRVANQMRTSSGSTTSSLQDIPNLDTLYLGENRSSYNPYNVTSPANGTFDEVYIYSSVRTQAEIQGNMNATHSCGGLDHIRIEHDGTGLTCQSESITIKTCDTADCSTLHGDPVSITLNTTPAGTPITQSITETGTINLRRITAGPYTLGITASSPVPSSSTPVVCNPTTTNSCDITFSNTGFIYRQGSNVASDPVITESAINACEANNIYIQAVRLDDTTQTCAPAFNVPGGRTINFWSEYISPATGSKQLNINANPVPTSAPGNGISLTFDANAVATFTAQYDDAGKIRLHNSFTETVDGAPFTMTGSHDLVSIPSKLVITSSTVSNECASADPTDPACTAFVKTGQNFNLTIHAACANNTKTENFRLSGIPLTANLIAPAGGNPAAPGVPIFDITAANGTASINNQTMPEVGVFTFTATPPANTYFGSYTVPAGTSSNIGRFTPDHFFMSNPIPTNRSDLAGCLDTFTYMDEDFRMAYTLQARNSSDVVTQNYTAGFAKLDPTAGVASFNYGATFNNTDYSSRLSATHTAATTSFVNGAASVTSTQQLARAAVQDGPLNPLAVGISPQDSDGTLMKAPYDLSLNGGATTHTQLAGNGDIRYGRFNIENAFGPQTFNLAMTTQAQHYDGTNFIVNTNDSCSVMNSGLINFDQWTDNLGVGDTQVFTINNPVLVASDAALVLTAPNSLNTLDDNNGSVRVTATVPTYLQYDWDNNGSDENPAGIATFGIYRGDDRIIFWREVQN